MSANSKTTTDHNTIRKWAEEHDGKPSRVKGTGDKEGGLLRINFPGYAEDNLEEISWDEFFKTFEDRKLALIYQEKTKDGKESHFSKFVNRDS